MAAERISSLDAGYTTGMLSLFPEVIDDKEKEILDLCEGNSPWENHSNISAYELAVFSAIKSI